MSEHINPFNINGAALIAQFSIILIMFIGTALTHRETENIFLYVTILATAIISFGCLLFTDVFSIIWTPLLQNISVPHMKWPAALKSIFILDIFCTFVLVISTDGSRNSPFTPLYFLLPALAIFLREPLINIVFYVIVISISFTIKFSKVYTFNDYEGANRNKAALWFTSIACLILTTFIGYITRPM